MTETILSDLCAEKFRMEWSTSASVLARLRCGSPLVLERSSIPEVFALQLKVGNNFITKLQTKR